MSSKRKDNNDYYNLTLKATTASTPYENEEKRKMFTEPNLIENKYLVYTENVLEKCHQTRLKVYSFLFNLFIFFVFFFVFASALYICRINKMTPEEKYQKQIKDKEYLLNKIRYFEEDRAKQWFDDYLTPIQRARQETTYFS